MHMQTRISYGRNDDFIRAVEESKSNRRAHSLFSLEYDKLVRQYDTDTRLSAYYN